MAALSEPARDEVRTLAGRLRAVAKGAGVGVLVFLLVIANGDFSEPRVPALVLVSLVIVGAMIWDLTYQWNKSSDTPGWVFLKWAVAAEGSVFAVLVTVLSINNVGLKAPFLLQVFLLVLVFVSLVWHNWRKRTGR